MEAKRWGQIKEVYDRALDLGGDEREGFLAEACAGDDELRHEVESLLAAHEEAGKFLQAPAVEVAAREIVAGEITSTVAAKLPATPQLIGRELANYRIVSLLGRGGMGEVYLAEDKRLRRKVALKMLPAQFTNDSDRVRRFEREAAAASATNHPNIVTIYEIGQIEQTHYMVTEFVAGETLRQRLTRGRMEVRAALEVGLQVAAALDAAHEAGIVHRDIKPENIMLRPDGLVKVLDFGLAKLTEPQPPKVDTQASTIAWLSTESGVVMGTVRYMSPEQARGQRVDHRTDIFSLGVVIYEMLAGRAPFEGGTPIDVMAAILTAEPAPLSEHLPEASAELERVVSKALRKGREERYQSVKDLLADLKILKRDEVAGQPGSAKKDRLPAVASPLHWLRWRPSRIILAVSVALVVVVFSFSYFRLSGQSKLPIMAMPRTIAVLPFKPLVAKERDEMMELGLADTLITKLGGLRVLIIRPTSAVRKYTALDQDPLAAGREQRVEAVLEASYHWTGERVRVTVRLMDVRDGASLWDYKCDEYCTDVFRAQDIISEKVAKSLSLHLTGEEQKRLIKHYTENPKAYEYYLKGKLTFDNNHDEKSIEAAIVLLKKAIEIDPNYALAHTQLAYCYTWIAVYIEPLPVWLERAKQALGQAQALDPDLAELHLVRHQILWSVYGGYQIVEAMRELRLAQQLNPSIGHHELGSLYYHLGIEDRSIRELQRALEINPTSNDEQNNLVRGYQLLGKHDEAIAASHQFFPDRPGPILSLLGKNRLDEAQQAIESNLAQYPNSPDLRSLRALLFALKGDFQKAEKEIPAFTENDRKNLQYHHATYNLARVYAREGKSQAALTWLKETVETGMPAYPIFAQDPSLDRIRKEPGFVRFMIDLKARWESYRREIE